MITGIDHIEIIVRDLDDYVAFLTALGFETVRQTDHHGRSVEMKPPGDGQPLFEIHQASGEEVIGINHIALKVDDAAAVRAAKLPPVCRREAAAVRAAKGRRREPVHGSCLGHYLQQHLIRTASAASASEQHQHLSSQHWPAYPGIQHAWLQHILRYQHFLALNWQSSVLSSLFLSLFTGRFRPPLQSTFSYFRICLQQW